MTIDYYCKHYIKILQFKLWKDLPDRSTIEIEVHANMKCLDIFVSTLQWHNGGRISLRWWEVRCIDDL